MFRAEHALLLKKNASTINIAHVSMAQIAAPINVRADKVLYTLFSREEIFAKSEFEIFSREDIFAKSEFEIFSREDIFANIQFTRKYLPAKISSRENNFPRKYLLAKISSRENIFLRFFPCHKYVGYSRPRLCGLGLLFHNREDPIQVGFVQQQALVVLGSQIGVI